MKRPLRETIPIKSMLAMGVPKNFCEITYDDFIPYKDVVEVRNFVGTYLECIEGRMYYGEGISFFGSNGVGKTMLSCIILREAYRYRYACRRITLSDYIKTYTEVWKDPENDSYDNFKGADLLVLDELGKEIDSKITKPILEELLRFREEKGLVTITCSNMTLENFREFYGSSICSLLNGHNTIIEIDAEDRR